MLDVLVRLVGCVLAATLALAADVSSFIPDNASVSKVARDAQGKLYVAVAAMEKRGDISFHRAAVVFKLDETGTRILYRREIGGAGYEYPAGLSVTPDGRAFVIGSTTDKNFPTTPGAFQSQAGPGESNGFLVALNADGSVRYSTFLNPSPTALAVNTAGEVYLANRGLVLKLDTSGSRQVFAFEGAGGDYIVLDREGNVFLAGWTTDPAYPTTPGAYQRDFQPAVCGGGMIGIPCLHVTVTKLNAAGTALVYSTFLAASRSEGPGALAVDDDGYAYVGVNTTSGDYPVTSGAVNWDRGGCVTKLNRDGSGLEWSACLGAVAIGSVVVERGGSVLVAGSTSHNDELPARCLFDASVGKGFVVRLSTGARTIGGLQILPDMAASMVAVTARVAPDLPVPAHRVACVMDPADYAYLNKAAPGKLLTLFGGGLGPVDGVVGRASINNRLPVELAGTQVWFDGEPAPLLYVSDRQINVSVPFGTAGRQSTRMQVIIYGRVVDERQLAIVPRDPQIFGTLGHQSFPTCTVDYNGTYVQGAVNPDGTINSCEQRASAGSVVAIFLHGLGLTGSQLPDGTINPVPPPALSLPVEVSNPRVAVEFAGAAAMQVTGMWQINVRLPASGYSTEHFQLTIDGIRVREEPFVVWIK